VKYHLCNVQVAASSHEMTYVRVEPSLPHLRMWKLFHKSCLVLMKKYLLDF